MNKNSNSDFIVCYTAADGSLRFTYYADPNYCKTGKIDITGFDALHPDAHVTAVFKANNNIFDAAAQEEENFINNCRNYGFEPEDYRRPVSDGYGNPKYLFIGFLPRNTKYKARLFNKETGRYIKATLEFVYKYMIFSQQEV